MDRARLNLESDTCCECGGELDWEPCWICLGEGEFVGGEECDECGGDGGCYYCPECDGY